MDAILVPGGFGKRGIEGMIRAIEFARGRKIPFFGICLGLQTAIIEFARNVCGLAGAHSTEFVSQPPYKVIYKMRELVGVDQMGGTMRLGKYPCRLDARRATPGRCTAATRSGSATATGTRSTPSTCRSSKRRGWSSAGNRPTVSSSRWSSCKDHPWFLACQFHPEFKSKPYDPAPHLQVASSPQLWSTTKRAESRTRSMTPRSPRRSIIEEIMADDEPEIAAEEKPLEA